MKFEFGVNTLRIPSLENLSIQMGFRPCAPFCSLVKVAELVTGYPSHASIMHLVANGIGSLSQFETAHLQACK